MKTILLCGYRSTADHQEDPLGLERDLNGRTLIERRLDQLLALGSQPICVLAGAFADEQLRNCKRLAQVEIAYDNAAPKVSLATNLAVGLEMIKGEACFALPVEVPVPNAAQWRFLEEQGQRDNLPEQTSLLQLTCSQGAPWHFGFPLLVTRFGNLKIQRLPGLSSLSDTRLKYLHIPVLASPT